MIDGFVGQNEEDGYWVSTNALPQSTTLALGKSRVVNALVVRPRVGFGPKDVVIAVSNDNINFTNVWSGQMPNGDQTIYFDRPRSVPYIRVTANTSYSPNNVNVQIREIEVYGPEAVDFSRKIAPSTVSYSSQNASYPAANAKDLNESTCWKSMVLPTDSSPQYLVYDLGATYTLNRVEVQPLINNGPKNLDIMVSTNGTNYSTVYTTTNNNKGELYTFNPVDARYTKLNTRSSYGTSDVAVAEMLAYLTGTSAGSLKEVPATTVSGSSSQNTFVWNVFDTLDGCSTSSTDGYWVSQFGPTAVLPEWLVYDFGKTQKISRVTITPRVPYGNQDTEIQVSTDGVRYTTVYSGTAPNGNLTVDFTATDARFVKILMKTSYIGVNVQIHEVEFFGPVDYGSDSQLNISTISATSEWAGYPASNMKDGIYDDNITCHWVGNFPAESAPQIVTSDLGASKTVKKVVIDSRMGAYAIGLAEVIILASNDGTNYSEVSRGYCSQGREVFSFSAFTARYIKVYIKSSYTTANVQIKELKVFGS